MLADPPPERLRIPPKPGEARSPARLRAHYQVERELADRLRSASREQRRTLYSEVYDELYRRVPDHSQLRVKVDPRERAARIAIELRVLRRFIGPDATFLEIGAGDCALSLAVAPSVRRVIALDVSDRVTRGLEPAPNFSLVLTDGQSIPVPPGSVTLAYSNQVMEHLHPEDAHAQLEGIRDALAPGGVYVCITPNRLNGPHDVSMYFDSVATGFHLHEYTAAELTGLMRRVGFSKVAAIVGVRGRFAVVPAGWVACLEWLVLRLPAAWRPRVAGLPVVRALIDIRLAATR